MPSEAMKNMFSALSKAVSRYLVSPTIPLWKYRTSYVADMRMLPEELPEYIESLQYLREKYREQIDIKIGLECEYFPEYIPWLKEQIKKYQLNYILFGNHHFHTDEKFPYFGHHTDNRDMLDLYEESAIEADGERSV